MAAMRLTITLATRQVEKIRALAAAGQAANGSAVIKHAVTVALSDVAFCNDMLQQALEQTRIRCPMRIGLGEGSALSHRRQTEAAQGRRSFNRMTLDAGGVIAIDRGTVAHLP